MEARTTRRRRATHPISHYWGLVKDMDDSQKLELVMMLVSSIKPAKAEPKEDEAEPVMQYTADDFAGAWATMDDEMLDAALAKFHKDWGGEGTAMEIADGLRGSRENSRTIETW